MSQLSYSLYYKPIPATEKHYHQTLNILRLYVPSYSWLGNLLILAVVDTAWIYCTFPQSHVSALNILLPVNHRLTITITNNYHHYSLAG